LGAERSSVLWLVTRYSAGLVLAGKTMSSLTCSFVPGGVRPRTLSSVRVARTNFVAPNNANAALPADAEEAQQAVAGDGTVYLRMKVATKGVCTFSVSGDGVTFTDLGRPVTAVNATWIGAKVGVFCNAPAGAAAKGHADVDYFHVEK